ncbi:MAG: DUF58 domain-containing protein [Planctomycetes bacterium]|nr:DUF58 domain-containing protein [Planctomycetota bacterium]
MRSECEAHAKRWRLALPRRVLHGVAGDVAARGAGSSVEFETHRAWVPGDDPRRVDWRAYARTERLQVRVTRAEVAPALDVVLDVSASMAIESEKESAARDLLDAARLWGRASGARVRAFRAGAAAIADGEPLEFAGGERSLVPRAALRSRSLRLCISDFLWPDDPFVALARLAADATHLFVVQLLAPVDLDPGAARAVSLVDCETDARIDLRLDESARAAYRTRLERHCAAVADAARRAGASHARVTAAPPATLFGELARQGLLEPA